MFITTEAELIRHTRISKLGVEHQYNRTRTLAVFRCDNCSELFKRPKEKISPKRLNNNYFHCCSGCDIKRFAQRTGVDHKKIWDMPTDADLDISKL